MKKTLLPALAIAMLLGSAAAAAPAALEVSAEDLTAAGVRDATAVSPVGDRFQPPVAYFRVNEKLSATDAKADCGDCGNLVAVYVAETPSVPGWVSEPKQQFVKVGGRLQVRAYIAAKKRIVTVTAPSEATARKISRHLVDTLSR